MARRSVGSRCHTPLRATSSCEFVPLLATLALLAALLPSRGVLGVTDPAHVAILKTFAALGNPSSPPFNAWTGDDPCGGEAGSAWAGIKCDTGSPYNSVTEIDIQDAQLSGDLPPSLFNLTSLRLLNLALNPNLTGSFPDALRNLLQLTTLDMHGCGLSGSIPATIGRLTSLSYFLVNQNRLSGSLPTQIGTLPRLYMLDVMENQLEGPLPKFQGANELSHLHMSNNLFTSVPAEISRLPKLLHLLMDSNRLTHDFPLAFNNTNLTVIYWSNNIIPGPFPSTWFFPRLKDFLFSNCSLPKQPLPSFPISRNLSNLDLSSNSFTGSIPGSLFWQHPNLVNLNLANNDLSSSFPPAIADAASLQSVFLSGNQLSGPLPDLSSLPSIVSLSLFDNSLSSLPPALLAKTNNITLQLFNNDLCKPFKPDYTQVCSPPTPLTQYTSPAFCDGLACENDLYSPSAPLYNESHSCVCVSPLRVDLELFISDFVVYHEALVQQLEQRIFSELTSKSQINISRPQVLVSAIRSPASLDSLASTFTSEHINHESTLIITVLFFPPGGDGSWHPRDTPQAIRNALTTRDLAMRVALGNFGLFRVVGFYGPAPYTPPAQQQTASSGLSTGAIVAISVSSAAVAIALIVLLLMRPWERRGDLWSSEDYKAIEGLQMLGVHRCKLKDIADATQGFKTLLGEGGYGQVYRGVMEWGEVVAVKRAKGHVKLCGTEFRNEIQLLSAVRHRNLVALKGFCVEAGEQLLVYEFIERGTLEDMLRGEKKMLRGEKKMLRGEKKMLRGEKKMLRGEKKMLRGEKKRRADSKHPLTWRQRVDIACGAASGFAYLHHQIKPPIIHRDVKTANILITAGLEAKVADFGISKAVPEEVEKGGRLDTQVKGTVGFARGGGEEGGRLNTLVKGTVGYLDPQYFQCDLLTEKSDVYSFGIVLLELATGLRPVTNGEHIRSIVIDRVTNHGGVYSVMDPVLKALWERQQKGDGESGERGGAVAGGGARGGGGGGNSGNGEREMAENEHLEETCGSEALQETFEWFLRLGMRCSLKQAQSRPDMQQVLKELEGIRRMLNCVSGSHSAAAGGGAAAAGAGGGDGAAAGAGAGGDGSSRCDYSERSNGESGGSLGAVNREWREWWGGQHGGMSSNEGDGLNHMVTFTGSEPHIEVVP
ncbi:unnamed protein product [Closterium sp. NIES-64]|nr:unnamed protein product [Closterium sp. NIES-64]